MSSYFGIPINEYNNYYKPVNVSTERIHKRITKIMNTFKETNKLEPFITDNEGNNYYHPIIFHFIAESIDVSYALKSAEIISNIHNTPSTEQPTEMVTICQQDEQAENKDKPADSTERSIDPNEIVDEISAPEQPAEMATTCQQSVSANTSTLSSYGLGQRGENRVLETIKAIKPAYEIAHVSSTGHVGDIHISDKVNMIKYLIEVKDKGIITKDDIIKFENDIKLLQDTNSLLYKHIFGIFISLESDLIPSIGKYKIANRQVYITKSMFSKDTMAIIFSMFESLSLLIDNNIKKIQYNVPVKVYELISRLRIEYNNIINEEEIYKNMATNCETNLLSINRLQRNNQLKKDFIKFINDEFTDVLPVIDNSISNKEEERLKEYIKTHKRKELLKRNLINEFPSYVTEISSMKLTDFINKYSK